VKDDDISLLVKRQMTNANVEKKQKEKNTKNESYTEVNNYNKKLSYRRGTARCVVLIEILPFATQQCRNYLYDKP